MNTIIQEIDILKRDLSSLLPLSDKAQRDIDKKIRLEFSYNSNHLEGNTLTYGETKLLLIIGNTMGDHSFREFQEMKAHDLAFELIKKWAANKDMILNEKDIRELNAILLVEPYWKEAITPDGMETMREIKIGEYKEFPNSVRLQNGEIFEYANPIDTPIRMHELMSWFMENREIMHPVELAASFHHRFVLIHPFDDGNGRISRLLVNYILLANGFPPVIIRSNDKVQYLNALNKADSGDISSFINYIGLQVISALNLYLKAALGENIEDDDDWEKELQLLAIKSHKPPVMRTPELTSARLMDSIRPLFLTIKNLISSKFSPLFNNTSFVSLSKKGEVTEWFFTTELTADLSKYFTHTSSENELISLKISLFKYLDQNRGGFDLYVKINVVFENYVYLIKIVGQDQVLLTKQIDEAISENDLELIKNKLGKILLEKIKGSLILP
ncbi:MAG: Fic family protein [Saprospiraceae bacterium]|nr:Fic family protein [Saprospiraceae bacterium]